MPSNDLRWAADPLSVQPSANPRKAAGSDIRTVVSQGMAITGTLESDHDVQVDGSVRGDIHCAQLIISRDATINGDIDADEVVIRGQVKGTIKAGNVILQDTAHVESEIFYASLTIDQGASFIGQSHFTREVRDAEPNALLLPKPELLVSRRG